METCNKKGEIIILWMSYIGKLNQKDDNYLKKGLFRKPLKSRISHCFEDDLAKMSINPFSE